MTNKDIERVVEEMFDTNYHTGEQPNLNKDWLRTALTTHSAKEREALLGIVATAIEENATFYEKKYGGNYEQCGRDIKFSIAQALPQTDVTKTL